MFEETFLHCRSSHGVTPSSANLPPKSRRNCLCPRSDKKCFSSLVGRYHCGKVLQRQPWRQAMDLARWQRDARVVPRGHDLPLQSLGVPMGTWQCALQALELSLASDACKVPASSEAPSELRLLVTDSSLRVLGQLAWVRAHPWCWCGGRIVPFNEWQAVYLDNLHG